MKKKIGIIVGIGAISCIIAKVISVIKREKYWVDEDYTDDDYFEMDQNVDSI